MKKYKTHIIWVLVVIVALIGGFFWGKASAGSARPTAFAGAGAFGASSTRRFGGGAGGGGGAGAAGGGFVTGQIVSMSTDSFTLQLANGNSEVVLYSTSTPVTEPTTVSVNSLTTGTNVMVVGSSNSDGSLTAQTIQVRTGNGGPSAGSSGAQ